MRVAAFERTGAPKALLLPGSHGDVLVALAERHSRWSVAVLLSDDYDAEGLAAHERVEVLPNVMKLPLEE
jgi:hypothetical protein